jgi:hypothetical protein
MVMGVLLQDLESMMVPPPVVGRQRIASPSDMQLETPAGTLYVLDIAESLLVQVYVSKGFAR